jgi:hypothetical protein
VRLAELEKLESMISRLTLGRVLWLLWLSLLVLAGCTQKDEAASPSPRSALTGDPSSGASALDAMHVIEERVSELRGLDTRQAITKAFMSTEELRQHIAEEFLEDYSQREARDDVLLYVAFDLMEPDVDLYNLLIDVQTEQVAGFYDPDTEEMYVIQGGDETGALERSVFSHEYVHVLQDQHFDLQEMGFTNDEGDEDEDSERQLAMRSLVEGDATLLQQQYMLQYFDFEDLQEMFGQVEATDMSVLDSAPAVLRESLVFPYQAGLAFVSALYNDGGWSAVDAAYKDPPLSTEQILHPERYPDDLPQVVTLPPLTDTLGAGWRLVDEDVMGEFGLQLYLNVHNNSSDVERAVEGWGGDRYVVHWREDESAAVLALRLAWDTPADATEFFDAYGDFAEGRFGSGPARSEGDARLWWFGDDVLMLAQNSQDETLILIAPDEVTLDALYALFPEF